MIGVPQTEEPLPRWRRWDRFEAEFSLMVRPSSIGGALWRLSITSELHDYITSRASRSEYPILIDRYILGKEVGSTLLPMGRYYYRIMERGESRGSLR